jgi:hypothetical protein
MDRYLEAFWQSLYLQTHHAGSNWYIVASFSGTFIIEKVGNMVTHAE